MIKATKGYSLLEVLLVLILSAILFALAIPAYRHLVTGNHAVTQINQLVAAINYARSEAIHRHSVVTLCGSNDSRSCSGKWSDGWIIFVDKKISGQVDPDDEILRVFSAVPTGSLLEWVGQRSNEYLQMDPSGTTHGQAGTFSYYPDMRDQQKVSKVVVSQTGRIRIEKNG